MHFYTLITIREFKNTIPFTNTSKRIKYLGINLIKEVKDMDIENYKTLMKKLEDTDKWKEISSLWIGSINIVKMLLLPEAKYRFNVTSIQLQWHFS